MIIGSVREGRFAPVVLPRSIGLFPFPAAPLEGRCQLLSATVVRALPRRGPRLRGPFVRHEQRATRAQPGEDADQDATISCTRDQLPSQTAIKDARPTSNLFRAAFKRLPASPSAL
ncbi:hypothetical protein GCM10009733_071570 [Nonomuraea maheshkhaliensis]|uniref:Uncharacterized protein n=1 Tax=Nonomuraea maheshkhaliensis TaxID=419590 RepID=A0ABP4S351_9ACTN